jgi:uncharacterized membrane protein
MFYVPLAQAGPPEIALWFMLLFIVVGLLMAGLSIPLILRRVKPNSLYGFRTPKTLSNERIWYDTNAFAGRLILGLGTAFALASIALYFPLGGNFVVYNVACGSILLAGVLIVLAVSSCYLRSCNPPEPPD